MPAKLADLTILQELDGLEEIIIENKTWLEFLPILLAISAICLVVAFAAKWHDELTK
jgi:hypothetical protein